VSKRNSDNRYKAQVMNIIEIENLTHRFPDGTLALDGIDLSIREGEFVVIAGRNGSGKTTLLRHFNALLAPTKGEVRIAGVSAAKDPVRSRQLVGMVFQDPDSQIVGETVADDVAFGPGNLGMPPEKIQLRVNAALAESGLSRLAERRPHTLSGGEKRKLAIAGVLAMEPKVVVFDEPFDSLDYAGIRQVLGGLVHLHQAGHTVLVTTHDIEKVIFHAGRLVVLDEGKVVRNGPPQEVIKGVEALGVKEPCASKLGLEVPSWLN